MSKWNKPKPPPVEPPHQFGVQPRGADQKPLTNAAGIAVADTFDDLIVGQIVNANGYLIFTIPPKVPYPNWGITVTIKCEGYVDLTFRINIATDGQAFDKTLTSVFKPAPRFWRGNMCGVRIPGLPSVLGGSHDSSLVLSWFYDRYNPTDRTKIRAGWKQRNLTHVLLSWPDSRGVGKSPDDFASTCKELINDGFFPCVFFYSKDYDPPDVSVIKSHASEVLPKLVGLIPLACVGWELSINLNPTQVQELIDWFAPQLVPSGCKLYVHFQQGYGSFQQPNKTFADFWNMQVGKLTGLLHQKILTQNFDQYRNESGGIVDILQRFAGNFFVVPNSGFGHPFDDVELEITASFQYDGSMDEATGNKWGQWAIDTPAQHGPAGMVGVMGSGNGCI